MGRLFSLYRESVLVQLFFSRPKWQDLVKVIFRASKIML